jgi:hypothetical protein
MAAIILLASMCPPEFSEAYVGMMEARQVTNVFEMRRFRRKG